MREQTRKRLSPRQRALADLFLRDGSLTDFATKLQNVSGEPVSWNCVYNWIDRGGVSRRMIKHVQKVTGAPLEDLL